MRAANLKRQVDTMLESLEQDQLALDGVGEDCALHHWVAARFSYLLNTSEYEFLAILWL